MFRRVRLPPLVKGRMTAALRRRVPIGDEKFVHVCTPVTSVSRYGMIRRELVPVEKFVHHSGNDARTLHGNQFSPYHTFLSYQSPVYFHRAPLVPTILGVCEFWDRKRLRDSTFTFSIFAPIRQHVLDFQCRTNTLRRPQ